MIDKNGIERKGWGGIQPGQGRKPKIKNYKMFEDATKNSGGVLINICKKLDCSRSTLLTWMRNQPPDIKKKVDFILDQEREGIIDIAENSLFSQVQAKEPWATKFALATIGRERGYADRQDININQKTLNVNLALKKEEVEELLEFIDNKDD